MLPSNLLNRDCKNKTKLIDKIKFIEVDFLGELSCTKETLYDNFILHIELFCSLF